MNEERTTYEIGDLITHGTFCIYSGPEKTIWLTRDGDQMYETVQWKDFRAMLDQNAKEAATFNVHGNHGSIVKLASVPIGLRYEWSKEGITDDPDALKRRLNDSDNAKFRVNNWRI